MITDTDMLNWLEKNADWITIEVKGVVIYDYQGGYLRENIEKAMKGDES